MYKTIYDISTTAAVIWLEMEGYFGIDILQRLANWTMHVLYECSARTIKVNKSFLENYIERHVWPSQIAGPASCFCTFYHVH